MQAKHVALIWKLRMLLLHPVRTFRLFRHPETPLRAKVLLLAVVAYVFLPFDLLPDLAPLIGQVDDIAVTILVISYALSRIPESVYESVGLNPREMNVDA